MRTNTVSIQDETSSISIKERLEGRRVLVTGANGFIGSHLIERLADLEMVITALGPSLGWRPILQKLVEQRCIKFINLSAFWNPDELVRLIPVLQGIEYVIHLAYVLPTGKNLLEIAIDEINKNVLGTMYLGQILPSSVSKICFASSTKVYGSNPTLPVSESTCTQPDTPYACGKVNAENCLKLFTRKGGISTTILRFSTVYGEFETVPRAIPSFIRCVLDGKPPVINGAGDDVRDYVHVSDIVEAIVLALAKDTSSNQIFNVGTGKGYSTSDIAERIISFVGRDIKPIYKSRDRESNQMICDITRAKKILGYVPHIELNIGLEREFKFFLHNPQYWRES